jgi:hypothetical protein
MRDLCAVRITFGHCQACSFFEWCNLRDKNSISQRADETGLKEDDGPAGLAGWEVGSRGIDRNIHNQNSTRGLPTQMLCFAPQHSTKGCGNRQYASLVLSPNSAYTSNLDVTHMNLLVP